MRRSLLLIALSLCACSSGVGTDNRFDPDAPQEGQAKAVVFGRVLLEGAEPLDGSEVALVGAGRSTTTDAQGRFELEEITPGVHVFRVSRAGYRSLRLAEVIIRIGDAHDLGDITLRLTSGVLRGRVTVLGEGQVDQQGVTVVARPAGGPGAIGVTATVADGSWQIDNLVEGSYDLSATRDGFAPAAVAGVEVVDGEVGEAPELTLVGIDAVLAINGGATFTNSRVVELRIESPGAQEMRIGEQPDLTDAPFEPYRERISDYAIASADDGPKSIYVQLRDANDQVGQVYAASIVLDTVPPGPVDLLINGGAEFMTARDGGANITLQAVDAGSGVRRMRLAVGGDASEAPPQDFVSAISLPLGQAEGLKEVTAIFEDAAGNVSAPVTDTIVLDYTPPVLGSPVIVVDGQSDSARACNVDVFLELQVEGAAQMKLANNAGLDLVPWAPFSRGTLWRLEGGAEDGLRQIHALFRDGAGNVNEEAIVVPVILDRSGRISGRVLLQGLLDGELAGSDVVVTSSLGEITSAVTDADGSFGPVSVRAGGYTLSISRPGFAPFVEPFATISACSEVVIDDIELPRATGTVRGAVVLAGETDFSNVQIRLSTLTLSAVSAQSGEFAISGVPVGSYEVTATRDGFTVGVASSVRVDANRTTDVGLITLAPASGDFLINGGAALSASRDVTIEISATTSQPAEVRVSEDPSFVDSSRGDVEWRSFARSLPFRLQDTQGPHEIFVQFRDTRGVASRPFSSRINLDSVAPVVTRMRLDGGAAWTRHPQAQVTLELDVSDETSGADTLRIAVDEAELGDPIPLTPAIVLPLGGSDGLRRVRVAAVDRAGNQSEEAEAEITLDREAPTELDIAITGDGAEGVTRDRAVDVTLAATGATAYALRNGAADCAVLSYRPLPSPPDNRIPHSLTDGNGAKVVRACFRDEAGNTAFVDGSIELDTLPPQDPTLSALEGAVVAGHEITLALGADGAATVLVSQDDPRFVGVAPVAVVDTLPFTLTGDDGPTTLYARYFDAAGNGSETVAYPILLQTNAPEIGLVIDLDAPTTNSETGRVELRFFAREAPEAFRVSEQPDFRDAEFEPFVSERVFFLSPGDGEKTVYAQFEFASGNVRDASDSIVLDTRIGGGGCAIGLETGFTNTREVTVRVTPQDDDVDALKVGFDPGLAGRVFETIDPLAPQVALSLLGGDGLKSVYVLMRDAAGNVSASPLVCRTVLDTQPPSAARVEIAGGQVFTNRRDVLLSLSAQDRNGVHELRVSNDADFSSHFSSTFATNLPWLLSEGSGTKTVYVELADPAGNVVVVSDEIELDPSRPPPGFVTISEGEFVRNTVVTLELESPLAAEFEVTGDVLGAGSGAGVWLPMRPAHLVSLVPAEGGKLISVRFRDGDGDLLGLVQARTVLDLNDPEITLVRVIGQSLEGEDDRLSGTRDVQVQVLAGDGPGSGAAELKLADSANFLDSGFVLFTPGEPVDYRLPESARAFEDMVVFVKVRDRAGRESEARSARITVDLRPPQVAWETPEVIRGDRAVGVDFTFVGDPFDLAAFELEARDAADGELLGLTRVRRELLDFESLEGGRLKASWSITELPAGATVDVLVRAIDAAGNLSDDSPVGTASVAGPDDDEDDVLFDDDNCPDVANSDQADSDGDGLGDVCDELDLDEDRILNDADNCPLVANEEQADFDEDGVGDACDEDIDDDGYTNADEETANQSNAFDPNSRPFDTDGDRISDLNDSCPEVANPAQLDFDGDGAGDACDPDDDGDGYADLDELLEAQSDPLDALSIPADLDEDFASDLIDNCPDTRNSSQLDFDGDGQGDRCDLDDDGDGYADEDERLGNQSDPLDALSLPPDADGDFTSDRLDNCPDDENPDQGNNDDDAFGDACDPDDDNDGFSDLDELFNAQSDPFNAGSTPPDGDGDLISDLTDNCPSVRNPGQENADDDPQGDACDVDRDNDAVPDQVELLAGTSPDDPQEFPLPQLVLEQIVAPLTITQGSQLIPLTLTVRNAGLLELRGLQAVIVFESLDESSAVIAEISSQYVTSAAVSNPDTLPALVRTELSFFVEIARDAFKGDVAVSATLSAVAGIGDVFDAVDDARATRRIWTVEESIPQFDRVQAEGGPFRTQSVLLVPGSDAAPSVLSVELAASDSDGTIPVLTALPVDRFGAPLPFESYEFSDSGDGTGSFVFTHSEDTPGLTAERSPFRITFRARDFEEFDTFADWVLVVALENTNAAPFFPPFVDTHVIAEREPLSFVVEAVDPEGGTPTLRADDLPLGVSLIDNGDGSARIDFTPDATQGGESSELYEFEIVASDPDQPEVETRAPISITVDNQPFFTPLGAVFPALEQQSFTLRLDARDPLGFHPDLFLADTADRVALADKVTFTDHGNGLGTFTFTPADGDARETPYQFRVDAILGERVASSEFGVEVARLQDNDLVDLGFVNLPADNRVFDDSDIIIDGGTVRIDGRHRFRNVLVRNGGVLSHSPATPDTDDPQPWDPTQALELHITGVLTIEAGAAIDVTGMGFAGAPVLDIESGGFTLGNTRENGSSGQAGGAQASGGSHGGQGGAGAAAPAGPIYGNPIWPLQPGSGGGRGSVVGGAGGAGGGVVQIRARLINLFGEIRANGAPGQGSVATAGGGGAGAGGSILLAPLPVESGGDGRTLEILGPVTGSSLIAADGGIGGNSITSGSRGANGGGGRVAIHASSVASNITVRASGGVASGWTTGASGTLIRHHSAATFASLDLFTHLSGIVLRGSGALKADSVNGAIVTVDRPLPMLNGLPVLVGAYLEPQSPNAAMPGLRILDHDETSLTLGGVADVLAPDAEALATPEQLAAAGLVAGAEVVDTWRFEDVISTVGISSNYTVSSPARLHLTRPASLSGVVWDASRFRIVAHSVAVPGVQALSLGGGGFTLTDRFFSDGPLRQLTLANNIIFQVDAVEASEVVDILSGATLIARRVVSERVNVFGGATLRAHPSTYLGPEGLEVIATHVRVDHYGLIHALETGYARGNDPTDGTHLGYTFGNLPLIGGASCHAAFVRPAANPEQSCVPYGNVYWPRTPGSSIASNGRARNGSGAIMIRAAGSLLLDGDIDVRTVPRGPAPGSILLDFMGTGRLLNSDGNGRLLAYAATIHEGSAGRIAVVDFVDAIPEAIEMLATGRATVGGPGTIFLREAGATFGDLLLTNNAASPATYKASLTPMGGGSVDAVAGNTLTVSRDGGAPLQVADPARGVGDLFRRWVEITLDTDETVLAQITQNDASSFTLDPVDGAPLEGRVSAGARWRGIYPFRTVIAGPGGGFTSTDPVVIFENPPGSDGDFVLEGGTPPGVRLPEGMRSLTLRNGSFPNIDAGELPPVLHLDGATVEIRGPLVADEVTLINGAVLQPLPQDEDGTPHALIVRAARLSVDASSTLNADARGYLGGFDGPGFTVGNVPGAGAGGVGVELRVGGAYGGLPEGATGSQLPETYGDFRFPDDFGSGGGADDQQWGGHGGGLIVLEISEALELDGTVSANGETSATDGAGSGGGIRIDLQGTGAYTSTSGTATIRARGGTFYDGGGGRIAVLDFVGDEPEGVSYDASGGIQHVVNGGPGTIYVRPAAQLPRLELRHDGAPNTLPVTPLRLPADLPVTSIDASTLNAPGAALPVTDAVARTLGLAGLGLLVETGDGALHSFEITGNTAESITVADPEGALPAIEEIVQVDVIGRFGSVLVHTHARIEVTPGMEVTSDVRVTGGARLAVQTLIAPSVNVEDGQLLAPNRRDEDGQPRQLHVVATDLTVAGAGSIDALGRGYAGSEEPQAGYTDGNVLAPAGVSGQTRIGGSYGGVGDQALVQHVYGDFRFPDEFGSGGGGRGAGLGGAGGGLVILEVSGTLALDGVINADGAAVWSGGSGGGIRIDLAGTGVIATPDGAGTITANGGATDFEGSGGRIALLDYVGALPPGLALEARSARHRGAGFGGAGTVFTREAGTAGVLAVDAVVGSAVGLTPLALDGVLIDALEVANGAVSCTPDLPDASIVTTVDAASAFASEDASCQ